MIMLEELEMVATPGDLADFITGVGTGIAIGMLICGGA
jgi:hypothetical protein